MEDVDPDGIFPPKPSTSTATQRAAKLTSIISTGPSACPAADLLQDDIYDDPRYAPSESLTNSVYRTVLIANISTATKLVDLTNSIRGGMLESIKLRDTRQMTGSLTALVVFLTQSSAVDYIQFRLEHPLYLHDRQLSVTRIQTPTMPIPRQLRSAIERGYTRCVRALYIPDHLNAHAISILLNRGDSTNSHGIISIHEGHKQAWHISFESVDAAGWALAKFHRLDAFEGVVAYFVLDPCAKAIETLLDTPGHATGNNTPVVNVRMAAIRASSGMHEDGTLSYDDDDVMAIDKINQKQPRLRHDARTMQYLACAKRHRDLDRPKDARTKRRLVRYGRDDEDLVERVADMSEKPASQIESTKKMPPQSQQIAASKDIAAKLIDVEMTSEIDVGEGTLGLATAVSLLDMDSPDSGLTTSSSATDTAGSMDREMQVCEIEGDLIDMDDVTSILATSKL